MGNKRQPKDTAVSGQSGVGVALLIGLGLLVGILYMVVFGRPLWEALYILPLAIVGTVLIFALFIVLIHILKEP